MRVKTGSELVAASPSRALSPPSLARFIGIGGRAAVRESERRRLLLHALAHDRQPRSQSLTAALRRPRAAWLRCVSSCAPDGPCLAQRPSSAGELFSYRPLTWCMCWLCKRIFRLDPVRQPVEDSRCLAAERGRRAFLRSLTCWCRVATAASSSRVALSIVNARLQFIVVMHGRARPARTSAASMRSIQCVSTRNRFKLPEPLAVPTINSVNQSAD